MKMKSALVFALVAVGVGVACSSEEEQRSRGGSQADGGAERDAAVDATNELDAAAAPDADKGARCAATFGDALTAPYGRLDGTVLAIVVPGNEACAKPNRDHVIVQLSMGGAAYRVVINVQSDRGDDPDVRVRELSHALVGPTFAPGWHTDAALDYPSDLGIHSTDPEWRAQDLPTLVRTIEDAVVLDENASAFVSTSGGDSSHLVHRNRTGQDGALVLGADGPAPRWLTFHFATQTF